MVALENSSSPEVQVFLGRSTVIASRAMRETLRLASRVACTSAAVLICGETGTGKEHIARAIHHFSLRGAKPWVDVNCAALPEQLMESELFGYERGAFSGAVSNKPGLFELADTGTIFLDEIGELDVRMQVKLLRVLDGVPYHRLGGVKKISVDVRIVAATNADLQRAMEEGKFRRDLYYRLSQLTIRVPPLRERRDDILPLAHAFLREIRPGASLDPEAAQLLESWPWPGNIRELRNAVTNAAVLSHSDRIGSEALPTMVRLAPAAGPGPIGPELSLDGLERNTILQALANTGGHQQRAADLLGISRRTLTRKLKQYRQEVCPEPCLQ